MDDATALLVTITGRDRPGITSGLCGVLAARGARIIDMEQVVIRERLILGILASLGDEDEATRDELEREATRLGVDIEFEPVAPRRPGREPVKHYVTVLGQPLRAAALAAVAARIAESGANIDRIVRLSRYPILSFELLVSGGDPERLRAELAAEAAAQHVDVGVQRAGLQRRAKRLIVMDVDSTLVAGEVIELLAEQAGCAPEVAALTEQAMAGDLDFEASLRRRVKLLAGLPVEALEHVRDHLVLTPGARTVVRTLKRLGFAVGAVSGGFTAVTDHLRTLLNLDFAAANELDVADGKLTGRLVGPIVDRTRKAELLETFAAQAGVPLSQTVAVGDGANDLDMLGRAGLGIAFNAKPIVARAADTAVSVPYLDAILFLLGITREEIEEADADDPSFAPPPRVPVPDP